MLLFIDTGDLKEIEEAASMGILAGVTTNPTLLTLAGPVEFRETIQRICSIVDGPVSAEVVSSGVEEMLAEAWEIATWAPNVVVKLPMTVEGLKVLHKLEGRVATNVTLVFSPNQALLAARAGATYVSPFVGRLDDVSHDGMAVVRDTVEIFAKHKIETKVLAASIRHPLHSIEAAKAGAHIATVPYKVLLQMARHPLTDLGLERFASDWKKAMGARSAVPSLAI